MCLSWIWAEGEIKPDYGRASRAEDAEYAGIRNMADLLFMDRRAPLQQLEWDKNLLGTLEHWCY
ncbi:hypothetical protein D5R40_33050 [Okeania hirsuta]|uniref:Uncharacterized protein n=1 Tax=Okeania hirsuta TaxID=1458930 RepID=A0A3N6NRB1_9CYAN|nr:hypothetical protein D5R40_33050 [Okeania hirsuta]